MTATPLTHPDKNRLIAFGLGKLDLNEAVEIETHLNECSDCCETLLDLQEDTFIGLLRESVDPKSAGESESISAATMPFPSQPSDVPSSVPAGLIDHPRYQISELIGKGGMGLVFKAEHKLMNRTVALKVINQKLVRNEEAVARFRREVQAAARLHHPNIVSAYDAEQAGNVHFLVMEYVDGVNLSEVVQGGRQLPFSTACDYIKQAADGLQHAHAKGMVHRDVKPHNLMVNTDGQVKILDFGLATLAMTASDTPAPAGVQQGESSYVTTLGTMMGTPDFISPEQSSDGRAVDIRSDIYSLGCTLYFLLAGRPPFNAGTAIERVKAHAELDPEPIENLRKDIPAELAAVIRRMIAKEPAARYQTPAEVAEALLLFAAPAAPQPQPSESKRISRTRWLIAAALAGSLLAAAAVFFIQQQKTTIRFQVDDASLAISFGQDSITVKDSDRQFTITPGTKQKFIVKQNGKELETDTFTLNKGQKVAIKVQLVNGKLGILPSDASVSIAKAESPADSVDAWVKKLTGVRNHMHTAFVIGPELITVEPDKGWEIVRKAWPEIKIPEVKTGILKAFAFSHALPKKHPKVLQVLHLGMTDPDREIQDYAAEYIKEFAHEDFRHDHDAYDKWYAEFGEKPLDEVMRLNESRLSESSAKLLAEFENAMRSGNTSEAMNLAADLGDTKLAIAIPTMIGAIDADNSYNTIYGVGYFGLGRITDVSYSPYHDGAWWQRWWEKNKSRYPQEIQLREIPEFPKTENGKKHKPFPEDMDTLEGKLSFLEQHPADLGPNLWNWAEEVASHKNSAAIPFLIGVIEADNTGDTVYGVGHFGLGELTGVRYNASHDGAWWRNWWEENKSKFPQDVQAIAIPNLKAEVAAWKKTLPQPATDEDPLADIADIPAQDLSAGGDKNKRYFLIGPRQKASAPDSGYKLLIVMPGGDGGVDFQPFVRRIYKHVLGDDYLIAQPVAFKWREDQQIVWPTRKLKVTGQRFATEDFVSAVVDDVAAKHKLDKRAIFTLSWSSGGPAAYAVALAKKTPVTGSYIAMSVFKPDLLPPLENGKGRAFYIEHSPQDQVCPFTMAEQANESLETAGATVHFNTYEGGHGWLGNVFGRMKTGIGWLTEQAAQSK